MDLHFEIKNQLIVRTDTTQVVNKSKNIYRLNFTITGDEWWNTVKYIIFHYNEENYQYMLEWNENAEAYSIIVPEKLLRGKSFRFTVFGIKILANEDTRITTRMMTIHSLSSGFTTNITTITDEPTSPDILTTVLERLGNKFDDLVFDEDNIICKSEGVVMEVVPLHLFETFYTRDETDSFLSQKAEVIHGHVVNDVSDFEENVDMDFDNFLTSLTENIRQI